MNKSLNMKPVNYINGEVFLPGSKSISNRILLMASIAQGITKIYNLLYSDDTKYMLNALKILGIKYFYNEKKLICIVHGYGLPLNISNNIKSIYLGNAGTAIRPLTALLSLIKDCNLILTGDSRMQERPIGHLVSALKEGGANITYNKKKFYPPISIKGGFIGGEISIDGSISSQFLSSLLMIAPLCKIDTVIKLKNNLVSKPYIDITLNLMKQFGILFINKNYKEFYIPSKQIYKSLGKYIVEGDSSSASYFLAAAAIKGGTVKVKGVGKNSIQGDVNFIHVLKKMGAIIHLGNNYISCTRNVLNSIDMDLNHIPDAAMTIAIVALFANGTTTIRNIYNWRVKETDRIKAMVIELRKVGAKVIEGYDYISITPPLKIKYAIIDTYNDHRMAMSFSLLSLSDLSVTILNPQCTSKTFPNYFKEYLNISHF
ncbi:3-phosphoshikimate 1-carboxyvinyltransferase [Buchnera aphidicola (Neophyllaphis podocarpi)]|uniref:3-phosphoshikimate 1-carboxyvinyltransferase n=1 Tax=Buchnera aphidicola TaxID=9 RepID=UPI0034642AEB